jgi:Secretion system C-terminal sorting domain/Electron transfer DM13
MKKFTLLAIVVISSFFNLSAQCTKTSTGFGNNTTTTMYNVQGTVNVVLNSTNSVSVNLMPNFSTASGPDVRVYLVNRGILTDAQLKIPAMFNARPKIEMGMSPASGMMSFTKPIPSGMNISDFDTVYFFCQQFSQFWDFGSFVPFTAANCTFLASDTFEKNNLKLYPNPVFSELNIKNAENLKFKIYNFLGNIVLTEGSIMYSERKIDVSNFNSGIYLLEFTDSDNNRLIKKFVKQ